MNENDVLCFVSLTFYIYKITYENTKKIKFDKFWIIKNVQFFISII